MEDNLIILFVIIGVVSIGILATLLFMASHMVHRPKRVEKPKTEKPKPCEFIRQNDVTGHLLVHGLKIPTFNSGTVELDDMVSITFYNNYHSAIRVTDVHLNGRSIFTFADPSLSYREKAEYAIQVLKQSANQNAIDQDLATEVEQIVLDVDALNEHLDTKKIVRVHGSDDYAWRG